MTYLSHISFYFLFLETNIEQHYTIHRKPMFIPLSHDRHTPQNKKSHPYFMGTELSKDRNWSDSELVKLSSFMLYHREKFQGERTRKQAKVFAVLSRFIKTRNVNQCRNYVHKLLAKFKEYDQIIQFFRESLPLFQENYELQLPQLERIAFSLKRNPKVSNNAKKIQKNLINEQIKEQKCLDNIEMKPTDVSYCDQPENHTIIEGINQQQLSHSLHIQNKQRSQVHSEHARILDQSYFSSQAARLQTQQQKKWKDCQEMFVAWTSKTAKMLEKYDKSHTFLAYQ